MQPWFVAVVLPACLILFAAVYLLCKNKKPLHRAFISMLSGMLALAAVDLTGLFTGVYLPISVFSVIVSAVGGIPGVASMLVIEMLM